MICEKKNEQSSISNYGEDMTLEVQSETRTTQDGELFCLLRLHAK